MISKDTEPFPPVSVIIQGAYENDQHLLVTLFKRSNLNSILNCWQSQPNRDVSLCGWIQLDSSRAQVNTPLALFSLQRINPDSDLTNPLQCLEVYRTTNVTTGVSEVLNFDFNNQLFSAFIQSLALGRPGHTIACILESVAASARREIKSPLSSVRMTT